jgi:hypothetical protein
MPPLSPAAILRERLARQQLAAPPANDAGNTVTALGAVQAQEYRGALWGIGLRTASTTEGDVERALAERVILRTWPMRGTLHLIASRDVRWMLRLLTPRVLARCEARNRQLALNEPTFRRGRARLERALTGGHAITRAEAYAVLERAGIATAGGRGLHVLMVLGMQGALCFGTRRGRQPTFVLLDEWVPESRALERDEALGELAARYFTSHGPATPHDFAWWSGLAVGDARRGVEVAGAALTKQSIAGREHWSGLALPRSRRRSTLANLLPPWDEFTVAYRDRDAFLDPAHAERTRQGIFSAVVLLDGRIAGLWRRKESRGGVRIDVELFAPCSAAAREALERAVARYGAFLGRGASLALGKLQSAGVGGGLGSE